jgi:DNA segregation ATPase FtsK/SpoIIIE, S-DNA-T family
MPDSQPDSLKSEIVALMSAIRERARAEEKLEVDFADDGSGQRALQSTLKSTTTRFEADRNRVQEEYEAARSEALAQFERDNGSIQADYDAALAEIEREFSTETEAAEKEKADQGWMVSSVLDDAHHESPRFQFDTFKKRLSTTKDRLRDQRKEMDETVEAAETLMQNRRQGPSSFELDPISNPQDITECEERFGAACRTIRDGFLTLKKQGLSRLFGGVLPFLLFFVGTAAVAAPIILFVDPALLKTPALLDKNTWYAAAAGAAAVLVLLILLILYGVARSKSNGVYLDVQQAYAEIQALQKRWLDAAKLELHERKQQFERRYAEVVAQRDRAVAKLEGKAARRIGDATERRDRMKAEADERYPALLKEIADRRDQQLEALDNDFQQKMTELTAGKREASESAQRQAAQKKSQRSSEENEARTALAEQWRAATSKFLQRISEYEEACRRSAIDWSAMLNGGWKLPDEVLRPIRIGYYDLDLAKIPKGLPRDKQLWTESSKIPVPLALPFPSPRGSLLFECQGEGRPAAVDAIRAIMLRLLTSLPGGKIRFTVLDPIGLGQELSAFMPLADYDELIIGTKIWTEKPQIEKKLTDLSEHMENVFQAYLRNEFDTIEEYNAKAGEVAEPYQFLIVANFPANFSDSAAQRLISIVNSGPRCGVYTILSVDTKQVMPHGFDLADIEAAAMTLDWKDGTFAPRDPELAKFPVRLESPPRAADFTEIVKTAGVQSKDARRVEVAFDRIAPKNGELWLQDSRTGLDVPLGRAGATKLQHLRLGKGTSQHVMIAGKTGSGKSSLLHTLICNLALHYSPDEVQFYLVDFKKGVEFKTYASHELPHARIIGIESDREFGISVLERLDRILSERGEKFRTVNAQDVKSYRKARPDEHMPRLLLIVDEFQEFFVEDDQLSAAANLLLDRLVRQGRAFGIHVLLGSQTLGGAYSLARSTLGQVAVRIALQCSESDAHLILSEENSAARLLTRPGEAIYNDSNGLLEGNHPFQIAWLPDDRRDDFLAQIQDITRAKGLVPQPTIVFEGNVSSDPQNNAELVKTIEAFGAMASAENGHPVEALSLWLGEPVSIKLPTPIQFSRRPGDNMMIVGAEAESARGILAVALITLAAQEGIVDASAPAAQFYVLDGDAIDVNSPSELKRLAERMPHRIVRGAQRNAAAVVREVAAEVTRRVADPNPNEHPIFLIVSNFSKFRDLRNEQDDFGFSSSMDAGKEESAGKLLADIFKDGPAVDVHGIIWCDSYSNLNRWITQQTLREFEIRVAFQMNSGDSSSLIDSPAASRLGGHRALLFLRETGKSEKLRPYAVPSQDWVEWVITQFKKKADLMPRIAPPAPIHETPPRHEPVSQAGESPEHVPQEHVSHETVADESVPSEEEHFA